MAWCRSREQPPAVLPLPLSCLTPSQDEEGIRLELLAAEQQEREAARERALAEQRERERRDKEERERAAREEKERTEQAKRDRLASRGGVRGVRGTRASMRGMRGPAAAPIRPGMRRDFALD